MRGDAKPLLSKIQSTPSDARRDYTSLACARPFSSCTFALARLSWLLHLPFDLLVSSFCHLLFVFCSLTFFSWILLITSSHLEFLVSSSIFNTSPSHLSSFSRLPSSTADCSSQSAPTRPTPRHLGIFSFSQLPQPPTHIADRKSVV